MNKNICMNCKKWELDKFWEELDVDEHWGRCEELPNDKMEVHIYAGRDGGGVDFIETSAFFGCVNFEMKG